ncbi:capsid protein 1 [Galliform chaphamaparvovirus 9]|nr:capsid protein 1 [Galliform chaphamaparvovirus 9]
MAEKVTFTNTYMTYIQNKPYVYPTTQNNTTNDDGGFNTGWHVIPNMLWSHFVTPRQWHEFVINHEAYKVEGWKVTLFNMVPMTTQIAIQKTLYSLLSITPCMPLDTKTAFMKLLGTTGTTIKKNHPILLSKKAYSRMTLQLLIDMYYLFTLGINDIIVSLIINFGEILTFLALVMVSFHKTNNPEMNPIGEYLLVFSGILLTDLLISPNKDQEKTPALSQEKFTHATLRNGSTQMYPIGGIHILHLDHIIWIDQVNTTSHKNVIPIDYPANTKMNHKSTITLSQTRLTNQFYPLVGCGKNSNNPKCLHNNLNTHTLKETYGIQAQNTNKLNILSHNASSRSFRFLTPTAHTKTSPPLSPYKSHLLSLLKKDALRYTVQPGDHLIGKCYIPLTENISILTDPSSVTGQEVHECLAKHTFQQRIQCKRFSLPCTHTRNTLPCNYCCRRIRCILYSTHQIYFHYNTSNKQTTTTCHILPRRRQSHHRRNRRT